MLYDDNVDLDATQMYNRELIKYFQNHFTGTLRSIIAPHLKVFLHYVANFNIQEVTDDNISQCSVATCGGIFKNHFCRKNFENRSLFDKVMSKTRCLHFWTTLYNFRYFPIRHPSSSIPRRTLWPNFTTWSIHIRVCMTKPVNEHDNFLTPFITVRTRI